MPRPDAQLREFLPHGLHDCVAGPSVETSTIHDSMQSAYPSANTAGDFAVHKIVQRNEMDHTVVRIDGDTDVRHSPQHRSCPEARDQTIQMADAVENRQYHGVWPNRRSELLHGFVK